MSKVRLDKIEERVLVDKVYCKYLDGTKGHWGKTYMLNEEDYNYLREQAERVQELEKYITAIKTQESINRNANKRIKNKNKRYREAIRKAISHFNQDEHFDGMAELQKVLSESK